MSGHAPERDEDGFGTFYRTEEQVEQAQVELDQPDAIDNVTWSPPTSRPTHSESPDDPAAEETIDERIAQEESEQGSAYGAPEAGGVLGGADDPAADEAGGVLGSRFRLLLGDFQSGLLDCVGHVFDRPSGGSTALVAECLDVYALRNGDEVLVPLCRRGGWRFSHFPLERRA